MRSLLPRALTPLTRALLSGPNYLPEAPPPNSPVEVKLQQSTLGGHEPSSVAPPNSSTCFLLLGSLPLSRILFFCFCHRLKGKTGLPAQAGLWGGSLVPPLSGGAACQLLGGRGLFLLLWEPLVGGLCRKRPVPLLRSGIRRSAQHRRLHGSASLSWRKLPKARCLCKQAVQATGSP